MSTDLLVTCVSATPDLTNSILKLKERGSRAWRVSTLPTLHHALAEQSFGLTDLLVFNLPVDCTTSLIDLRDSLATSIKIVLILLDTHPLRKQAQMLGYPILTAPYTSTELQDFIYYHISQSPLLEINHTYEKKKSTYILVASLKKKVIVPIDYIVYISAGGNYSTICTADGSHIVITKQLGKIASELPANRFIRVHHSFIVNLKYTLHIKVDNGPKVYVSTGHQIPIARRKQKVLSNLMFVSGD